VFHAPSLALRLTFGLGWLAAALNVPLLVGALWSWRGGGARLPRLHVTLVALAGLLAFAVLEGIGLLPL